MRGVAHTIYGGKVGETMGLLFYCRQTFGLKCATIKCETKYESYAGCIRSYESYT